MPILKLGRRAVAGLPRVTKPTIFYDTDLTGFGIKAMMPELLPRDVKIFNTFCRESQIVHRHYES